MITPKKNIVSKQSSTRLLYRAQFLRASGTGVRYVSPAFILQVAPPITAAMVLEKGGFESPTNPRFGLTATKKLGNAVIRNRARRRLRSLAQEILLDKAVAGDYVLIAREACLKKPFAEMRHDLEKALRVLKCLK